MAAATPSGTEPGKASQPPSGKRKGKRKYGMDMDVLECPICSEPFSPPVYQCQNGHTVCSACCKKLVGRACPTCTLPTGRIRCIAVEKMLESLMVCCKYASNGCDQMLKQTEIKRHEDDECNYKPFRCPFKDCKYEGSNVSLPGHLAEEHEVPTFIHNSICGAGFRMESSVIVMVKGDQESDLLFLVHRARPSAGDDIFFCTSLGTSYKSYDLKVKLCSSSSLVYSMVGACPINLLDHRTLDTCERDYLLLPWIRNDGKGSAIRPVEVLFRLSPVDDIDDIAEAEDD